MGSAQPYGLWDDPGLEEETKVGEHIPLKHFWKCCGLGINRLMLQMQEIGSSHQEETRQVTSLHLRTAQTAFIGGHGASRPLWKPALQVTFEVLNWWEYWSRR